jgi:hypothetical protein
VEYALALIGCWKWNTITENIEGKNVAYGSVTVIITGLAFERHCGGSKQAKGNFKDADSSFEILNTFSLQ